MDIVIFISRSLEFPGDLLLGEISRVLEPGGTVLIYMALHSVAEETDKVIVGLERKLLLAGFLEAQGIQLKSVGLSGVIQAFGCGLGDAFRCSTCLYNIQTRREGITVWKLLCCRYLKAKKLLAL